MILLMAICDNGDGSCSPVFFKTYQARDKWCNDNPELDRSEGGTVLDTDTISYVEDEEE